MAQQTEPNTALANITGQKVYTEPPRHEWTCKNCKFWESKYQRDGFADCEVLSEFIDFGHADYLYPHKDFGCIKFEGK